VRFCPICVHCAPHARLDHNKQIYKLFVYSSVQDMLAEVVAHDKGEAEMKRAACDCYMQVNILFVTSFWS